MMTMRGFFWPEDVPLKRKRLLLCAALLLVSTFWFALGALLTVAPNNPTQQFLWGSFWLVGIIIALVFTHLLKTRQCQRA